MPEMNKDNQTSNPYWGNTKAADIENKKFVNVGLDIVKGSDIAQQFAEQNINFFARNNEMLSVANIIVNNTDYAKAMDIVKNATHKLMPDMEFKDNFFGNTNYADIPDKKIMIMGNEASSKIQLNKLMNDNNISFSAREFAVNQVTAITINKADSERVESLIRNALNPVQQQEQKQEQSVQQENHQPKHSKVTVSSDLRLKIGQELLKNDVAFSTNIDTASKTATFTVNTQDMPLLNEIMMKISKEATQENVSEKENAVNETIEATEAIAEQPVAEKTAPTAENTVAETQETSEITENTAENEVNQNNVTEEAIEETEEEPVQPMELTETIQALKTMADNKRIDLDDTSYRPPVAKAYDLLNSIDKNTFKTAEDSREVKAVENVPIDFGEKISPIFKLSMANHEASLNRLFEKNDTLNAKIEKNQNRIEALNNKIDTLQHNNSLLTAIKNTVPFAKGIADKLIEQNNKEIKSITEDKIPKREQKIEKHKGKIEKNNVSISETMKSLKQISAVNKFITSFKSINADERRDSFINGLTAIANISVNNAVEKRDKAVTRLKDIAETFNSTERTPLTVISAQNEEMIKLTSTIEKQQNKIEKASSLINNLERVLNGELLQNRANEVIETAENAVANEIASANISENTEITGENLTDTIVDTASKVINSAVEQEQQLEKNVETELVNEHETKIEEQIAPSEKEADIKFVSEEVGAIMNEIFTEYANQLYFEKEEIAQLPDEVQQKIADKYSQKPFDEENIYTYKFDVDLNNMIMTEININALKNVIGAENLAEKGIEISDINVKPLSMIKDDYLFGDPTMTSEDFDSAFTEGIKSITFTNAENESVTFTSYIELENALNNPDSFFNAVKEDVNINQNVSIENTVEKENPIKHIEELIEANDNHIDGVINNLPVEEERQPEPVREEQPIQAEQQKEEKEVSEKVVELLADIVSNYSSQIFFDTNDLMKLPNEIQEKIADMYSLNPFNEDDTETYNIDSKLHGEIIKEINVNNFKGFISADELADKGITISDIKFRSEISNDYLFSDPSLEGEDLEYAFSQGIKEISFINENKETVTFTGYTELEAALKDVSNSFFNKSKDETVIVREERPENPEPVVTEDREQKILNEIAAATGFSASQLDSLPKDIKADIIAEYEFNGGNINSEAFTAEMASILNVEPPKTADIQPKPELPREEKEKSERDNQSKASDIDRRTNDTQQQQEKKSRFSIKDLHSERYAPRSRQNEQDRQNSKNRNGMELD